MTSTTHYDLIIVGGGTAGFAAALKANELGANTLMVNDNAVGFGGTCLNVGCMPTKRLLRVGEVLSGIRNPGITSVDTSVSFDFTAIMEDNEKMVERLRHRRYEKVLHGVPHLQFVAGTAIFTSDTTITVEGALYSADKFIVATGSSPVVPPIKG